jgi:hypothetical protein
MLLTSIGLSRFASHHDVDPLAATFSTNSTYSTVMGLGNKKTSEYDICLGPNQIRTEWFVSGFAQCAVPGQVLSFVCLNMYFASGRQTLSGI